MKRTKFFEAKSGDTFNANEQDNPSVPVFKTPKGEFLLCNTGLCCVLIILNFVKFSEIHAQNIAINLFTGFYIIIRSTCSVYKQN